MRRYFYIIAAVVSALMLTVSCDNEKPDSVNPNFPEAITVALGAGESYTLSLQPNTDWNIELKYETVSAGWFWIQDGNSQAYSLRGLAGQEVDVVVFTGEQTDFDYVHSCTLEMTMGEETKVIATFTRATIDRHFELSYCKTEDGEYVYSEDDSDLMYEYNEPISSEDVIPMEWIDRTKSYRRSLLIEADFDWQLKSKPEWMDNLRVTTGDAFAQVEVEVEGDPTKYPLEDTVAEIVFCASDNMDAEYVYGVAIPGCGDVFEINGFMTESEANKEGEIYREVMGEGSWSPVEIGVSGYVLGIEGAKVYTFIKDGDSWVEDASAWITATLSQWEEGGAVLQERELNIKVTPNESDASREALVVAMPAKVAPSNASSIISGGEIVAQYADYVVTHLTQLSVSKGLVFALSPENFSTDGAVLELLEDGSLNTEYGTQEAYRLTYDNPYASISQNSNLDATFAISSWQAYDENGSMVDASASWIKVEMVETEISDNAFRVVMTPENTAIRNVGYIVLNASGTDMVVIECVYDEGGGQQPAGAVSIVGNVSGVTLVQVTEENVNEMMEKYKNVQNYNGGASGLTLKEDLQNHEYVYILTYTSAPKEVELVVPEYMLVWLQSCDGWVEYEESTVGDQNRLTLTLSDPGVENVYGMVQLWKDWSASYKAQIYCIPEL